MLNEVLDVTITIGLAINKGKPKAVIVARELVYLIEEKRGKVYIQPELAIKMDRLDIALAISEFPSVVDIVFVLGGDGSLLGIARDFAQYKLPILGINVGNLGFLSEAEPDNLSQAVDRIFLGDYQVERRMRLDADVVRNGKVKERFSALNEVGISKGSFGNMIMSTIWSDDYYVTTYSSDGVIISTPTGSTAYSLSAGGPIVNPRVNAILITPICPHTLTSRPILVPGTDTIRISVSATHQDIGLTVDGQIGFPLKVEDEIIINRSPFDTYLVKWKERSFFEVVRKKLQGDIGGAK